MTERKKQLSGVDILLFFTVESTLGPMAQDVEALVLTMKALLVPYHWELDPTIAPLPFRDEVED